MAMMRDFGLRCRDDAEDFLGRERENEADGAALLPIAWKRAQACRDSEDLRRGRYGLLLLLPALYAFRDAEAFRSNSQEFLKYSVGSADTFVPTPGDLYVDIMLAVAAGDRALTERLSRVAIESPEREPFGLEWPPLYTTRAVAFLHRGQRPDAEAEIAVLSQQCAGRRYDRAHTRFYECWCAAARSLLAYDAGGLSAAIQENARARRAFVDAELARWKRGKPNVELRPKHFFDIELTSLLLVADAAGLDVYKADDPDFSFCDWQWVRSVWA